MGGLDIARGVMEVAGSVPAASAAHDAATIPKSDEGNVALSAVSAVPVVGDAAQVAGESLKIEEKDSKLTENAASKAKKMASLMGSLKGKMKTGAKKIRNKISRKNKERKAKRESKQVCTQGSCLTGDMLVYTKQGLRPIKEIQKGDDIYARDVQTGEVALCKVLERFQTQAHTIHHIWLDGKEELKITAYHPVFVKGKGWVNAINLREGDRLETMDGAVQVTRTVKTRHEKPVEVYNFHVEELASYFVSRMLVYVHNTDCGGEGEYKPPKITENDRGELTNGQFTLDSPAMETHTDGVFEKKVKVRMPNGKKEEKIVEKSQFLHDVDADKAVLDAAAYAEHYKKWKGSKAKVPVANGPVGITGDTRELTNYLNVYKSKHDYVHGSPGRPPKIENE